MGSTYDALARADRQKRERSASPPLPSRSAESPASGWRRVMPGSGALEQQADELDLPLPTLRNPTSAEDGVDWGGFIFDQVGSIDQKLEELHLTLEARFPESEARLQKLVEARLAATDARIGARLSGISRRLGDGESRTRLHTLLLGINLALLLFLLLLRAF